MGVLVDKGVFYVLYDNKDVDHLDSVAILFHALEGVWGRVFTTNYVTLETTLLLHSRVGPRIARVFPKFTKESGMSEVFVDEDIHSRALEAFIQDKETSLTDAVTTEIMNGFRIRNLATYDESSFAGRVGSIMGKGYWQSLTEGESREVQRIDKRDL